MKTDIQFELLNIDRENDKYSRIVIKDLSEDLSEYIVSLRSSIIDERETRVYKTSSETTEVFTSVKRILEDEKTLPIEAEIIAKRLLRIEVDTQTRYDHIAKIKKGSLFISKFEIDNIKNVLVVKIEHTPFIDENDFKKHIGLPFENEVLKSCLFQFDIDNQLFSIMAHDSNITVASYWWNSFLELAAVNSDEQNTVVAFSAIDRYLSKSVKQKSPSDYTLIRNNLIGYFKTQSSFSMRSMADYIVGSYIPQNKELKTGDIRNGIMELQTKSKFDASFTIVPKEVNARMRTVVKVNSDVELRIQDHAVDLKTLIHGELGSDGKKYLKVLADDDAFERFNYTE